MRLLTLAYITVLLTCLPQLFATGSLTDFAGTDGMNLFQFELNSRVNGLGGAYCAAAEDVTGLTSNPAGLVPLNRNQAAFVHLDWFDDTSVEYLAYAQPVKFGRVKGTMGGSWTFLHLAPFINYDKYGYPDGTVDFGSSVINLAYAMRLKQYSVGMQLKWGVLGINDLKINAFAADLGTQFFVKNLKIPYFPNKWLSLNNVKVGIALQNISTKAYTDIVPLKLKAGLYYPVLIGMEGTGNQHHSLYATLDLNKYLYNIRSVIDLDYRLNAGVEYVFRDLVFVRCGFKLGYDLNFFTAGVGIRYRFKGFDTHVDYVYSPYAVFNSVNNFSVNTKFDLFETISGLNPNQQKLIELHYYKGLSYFVQEEFEKAILEWNKALTIDPENKVIQKKVKDAEDILKNIKK